MNIPAVIIVAGSDDDNAVVITVATVGGVVDVDVDRNAVELTPTDDVSATPLLVTEVVEVGGGVVGNVEVSGTMVKDQTATYFEYLCTNGRLIKLSTSPASAINSAKICQNSQN
jgi:hypothetical protein